MGLVAVETRNYTDIKNTTHKQYLQRAIAVADEAEQKKIAQNYKIYSMKISMSDDEYLEYLAEKQKDYKSILALIPALFGSLAVAAGFVLKNNIDERLLSVVAHYFFFTKIQGGFL